jgi:hypothetical protein
VSVTIDAGILRQTAALSARTAPVGDGDGGYTTPYVALDPAQWRCAIERASATNANRHFAASVIAYATHILRGRYHPDISTGTRIVWTDRNGDSHTADVVDAVDTEGAGVETMVAAVEQTDPVAPEDSSWVQGSWVQ